ncbi:MAG: hypothetical protein HKN76_06290, partial [Saprospiraceae bacterium]|nr:hypothetical protein [Saprospiraceae bacterium]
YNTGGCGPIGGYTFPVFEEKHSPGGNSLTGGFVYRGPNACLNGLYFCAEYLRDTIYTIAPEGMGWSVNKRIFAGINNIAAFGEGEDGTLYAVRKSGTIYKITVTGDNVPGGAIPSGTYTSDGPLDSAGSVAGTVTFESAEAVILNPQFEVLLGAVFSGIVGCSP